MSDINSQITRIKNNVADTLTAISNKGVTIPANANSNNLATLVSSIQAGGGLQ